MVSVKERETESHFWTISMMVVAGTIIISHQGGVSEASSVPEQCLEIETPLCRNVIYNRTQLPNILGNTDQEEALAKMHDFYPLVSMNCSVHLVDFLCAVFLPKCQQAPSYPSPILPCGYLCQTVKNGCMAVMNRFGFLWPFDCDKFPSGRDSVECFTGHVGDGIAVVEDVTSSSGEIEMKEEEMLCIELPTDCFHGNYNCRNSDTRAFINGVTMCCSDGKEISFKSSCDQQGKYTSSCKCAYSMPIIRHDWCH